MKLFYLKKITSLVGKGITSTALLLVLTLQAFAYDRTEVKIGVVGENNEYWQPIIDRLAAEGVKAELVRFSTYPLPNRALEDGEIDLNAFQTGAFLKTESEENGYHLKAIGTTLIAPLGLYSKKYKRLLKSKMEIL
jgi:D-methionine transport system substrate-binding protein